MLFHKFLKDKIGESGMSYAAFGARIGVSASAISNIVGSSPRSVRVGNAAAMANELGYELVAVPCGSRLPKGSVVVDAERK